MPREEDREFFRIFSKPDPEVSEEHAPTRIKARVYSTLIREQQKTGHLQSISEIEAKGHSLCVFEKLVEITPVGEKTKSRFFCWTCHARVAAENIEKAPIFWPGCPYADFQKP
jgi:hypothetical protein